MFKHEEVPKSVEQKAQETLEKMAHALAEAAAAVEPDERHSLLEIFPAPGERRADAQFTLPPEREEAFREAMAKMGIGRETNVTASEAGLQDGYVAIIDGGQAHKIVAELQVALSDETVRPSVIIVAATPQRRIKALKDDPQVKEREVTAKVLGIDIDKVHNTEYEVAKQVVEALPGYEPYIYHANPLGRRKREDPDKSYGISAEIGTLSSDRGEISVIMLPLIGEDHLGDGKYKQPGTRAVLDRIHQALEDAGDIETEIGFVTSSTYQPSREVDAASAMLEIERAGNPRNIAVLTYGTHELARAKKEQYPEPPALGQLAGEAHKAAQQVEILRNLLNPIAPK